MKISDGENLGDISLRSLEAGDVFAYCGDSFIMTDEAADPKDGSGHVVVALECGTVNRLGGIVSVVHLPNARVVLK